MIKYLVFFTLVFFPLTFISSMSFPLDEKKLNEFEEFCIYEWENSSLVYEIMLGCKPENDNEYYENLGFWRGMNQAYTNVFNKFQSMKSDN